MAGGQRIALAPDGSGTGVLLPSQAALIQRIDIPNARHGNADRFTRQVQGNRL